MWHLFKAKFLNLNINKNALKKIIKQHKLEMVNRIVKYIKII